MKEPRFEQGYSQIVDWFWKLDDFRRTGEFAERFGAPTAEFTGLLVIGRETFLSGQERDRLEWRRRNVIVNSQHVYCCTYDELCRDLRDTLSISEVPLTDR